MQAKVSSRNINYLLISLRLRSNEIPLSTTITRTFSSSHRHGDTDSYLNYESDKFINRHIGPRKSDKEIMLQKIGYNSIDDLINATIPNDIQMKEPLSLSKPLTESQLISRLKGLASNNQHNWRSFIGMGYYNCHTPPVILRNVLENPGN